MMQDLRIALVGLAGAAIGGLFASGAVIYSEHAEGNRETDREHRQAVGAARLFVDEFRSAGLYFERCIQTGKFEPVPPDAAIELSEADRKLAAGHLSSDAYGRASEAAVSVNIVIRTLRSVDPKRGPWPILEGAVEEVVHAGRDESIEAREALRPLTGETPAITPKPPLRSLQPDLP
jgi:hypothetical protein